MGEKDARLKAFSRISSIVVSLGGGFVLFRWLLTGHSSPDTLFSMSPDMALAFVMAGISLGLLQSEDAALFRKNTARALALIAMSLGILSLMGSLGGIGRLLAWRGTLATGLFSSPLTSLYVALAGSALVLTDTQSPRFMASSNIVSLSMGFVSILLLFLCAFCITPHEGIEESRFVSMGTALTAFLLSAGILSARPQMGWMAKLVSSEAGEPLRWILIAMVTLPLALPMFGLASGLAGFEGPEPGWAAFMAIYVFLVGAAAWWYGRSVVAHRESYKTAEQRFRTLVEQSPAVTYLSQVDNKNSMLYVSPKVESLTGYTLTAWMADPLFWLTRVHPNDRDRVVSEIEKSHSQKTPFCTEYRMITKDDRIVWCRDESTVVHDENDQPLYRQGVIFDVSSQKQMIEEWRKSALYDDMTGLPNRTLFLDRLQTTLNNRKRNERRLFAVLFLDVDRFKEINDRHGHLIGDRVLTELGKRFCRCVRPGDTVARLGGDEFIFLLDDIVDVCDAEVIATRIHNDLTEPLDLGEQKFIVSVSIGVAVSTDGHQTAEEFLHHADMEMLKAKSADNKGRRPFGIPEWRPAPDPKIDIDIREAVRKGRLQVYYQPIVSAATGMIEGSEALVRWKHPARGMILPSEFLPAAERSGIMHRIDQLVVETACRQTQKWHEQGLPQVYVSVNVSPMLLMRDDAAMSIRRILDETGLDAGQLKVEVKEFGLSADTPVVGENLKRLVSMGVGIMFDDFGSGPSSLSLIRNFPEGSIKLDRFLIGSMAENSDDAAFVSAVIDLSHSLNIRVVAAGVETEEQRSLLRSQSCDDLQGYLISPPVPAGEFTELLCTS